MVDDELRARHAHGADEQLQALWDSGERTARVVEFTDALVDAVSRGAKSMIKALWRFCEEADDSDGFARYKVRGRFLVDRALMNGQPQLVPTLLELGAFMTEKAFAQMAESQKLLDAFISADQTNTSDYTFGGEVACTIPSSNYYHDLGGCVEDEASNDSNGPSAWFHNDSDGCRCKNCHSRWVKEDMKMRGERNLKAMRCDDTYYGAIRRVFGVCIQSFKVTNKQDQWRLHGLVATLVPVLPLPLVIDIALLMVRANCVYGIQALCNHWEVPTDIETPSTMEDLDEPSQCLCLLSRFVRRARSRTPSNSDPALSVPPRSLQPMLQGSRARLLDCLVS